MKINTNEHIAAIRDGVPIIAITTRALARLNPSVFRKVNRRDGYNWKSVGLNPFSNRDRGNAIFLSVDEVVMAFDKLPDGFTMPISSHHGGCNEKENFKRMDVELLTEIRNLLQELLNVWKSDSKSVPEHVKLD